MSGGLGDGGTENLASVRQCQIESRRQFGVEERRRGLVLCQAKEDTALASQKTCVPPRRIW